MKKRARQVCGFGKTKARKVTQVILSTPSSKVLMDNDLI